MRIYKVNHKGEKMYQLECTNFECKYSPDEVITVIWRKEYEHDLHCEKCGRILTETMANWEPMPALRLCDVGKSF